MITIKAPRLTLRTLNAADISPTYLGWMNEPEVIRYLESRFNPPQSLDDLAGFVNGCNARADTVLLGMFLGQRHIGNIKLGPIDSHHDRGDIGLVIGEKSAWGQGYASEAIAALATWAFGDRGLAKLTAGAYAANLGSIKAFLKAGFREEGRPRGEVILDGARHDIVRLGRLREDAV